MISFTELMGELSLKIDHNNVLKGYNVNYGNIIAECLFNPNSILFVDYDRLSHSGT